MPSFHHSSAPSKAHPSLLLHIASHSGNARPSVVSGAAGNLVVRERENEKKCVFSLVVIINMAETRLTVV